MDAFPPEYVDASNAGRIVGVVGAFHLVAFTFVSLRLYVRLFMVRAFGIDDVLIIAAAVSDSPVFFNPFAIFGRIPPSSFSIVGPATDLSRNVAAPRTRVMDLPGPSDTLRPWPARAYAVGGGPDDIRAHRVLEDGPLGRLCLGAAEDIHGDYTDAAWEESQMV